MNLKSPIFAVIALLIVITVTACATKVLRGEPPFIAISTLQADRDALSARFDISNRNGVEMNIDAIEARLEIADAELIRYNDDFSLQIGPNGTEEVFVDNLSDSFRRELLDSLESGEVLSLPFRLEGRVHTLEDGYLKFSNYGHLYPVPGRPGQFRSATTRERDDG